MTENTEDIFKSMNATAASMLGNARIFSANKGLRNAWRIELMVVPFELSR